MEEVSSVNNSFRHKRTKLHCGIYPPMCPGYIAFRGPHTGEIQQRAVFRFSHAKRLWRRNLVCCHLVGNWCGANDHKFSKYDAMETLVLITSLSFSVLFLNLSLESVISLHSFCDFHEHHQIGTGGKSCYAHIPGGNIWQKEKMEYTMAMCQRMVRGCKCSIFKIWLNSLLQKGDIMTVRISLYPIPTVSGLPGNKLAQVWHFAHLDNGRSVMGCYGCFVFFYKSSVT